jgi:hypothetical protein
MDFHSRAIAALDRITKLYYRTDVFTSAKAVENLDSPGFFDNKRKKDVAAAAALKETGGGNEFRHPFEICLRRKGRERRLSRQAVNRRNNRRF